MTTNRLGTIILLLIVVLAVWIFWSSRPRAYDIAEAYSQATTMQILGREMLGFAELHDGNLPLTLADLTNIKQTAELEYFILNSALVSNPTASDVLLVSSPSKHKGGDVLVLFGDGQVWRFVKGEEFLPPPSPQSIRGRGGEGQGQR